MYFLGIDTSTTSSKALLVDERGEVIAVASSPHTLRRRSHFGRSRIRACVQAARVAVY